MEAEWAPIVPICPAVVSNRRTSVTMVDFWETERLTNKDFDVLEYNTCRLSICMSVSLACLYAYLSY